MNVRLERLRPVRSLPGRAFWRANTALTSFGERHGIDWLTYNPLQMYAYHLLAGRAAPAAIRAMGESFPDALRYVDVGAGSGAFAAEALRRGREVRSYERSRAGRLYARLQGVQCRPFDLNQPVLRDLDGTTYDLAYCFEVAEHLSQPLGDRLVSVLCRLAPIVVFSAAGPGQGGLGHVNEQPLDYWRERFDRAGRRYRDDLTDRFRARLVSHGADQAWLLSNTMIFTGDGATTR